MAKHKRVAPIFQVGAPGRERFILWGMGVMDHSPEQWFNECTAPTIDEMKSKLSSGMLSIGLVTFLEFEWED